MFGPQNDFGYTTPTRNDRRYGAAYDDDDSDDSDGYGGGGRRRNQFDDNPIAEDPIVSSPFAVLTNINISIFVLVWYAITVNWNLVNYVAYLRFNAYRFEDKVHPFLYLAFCIIALGTVALVLAPLLVYTGKYVGTPKKRNRWLSAAIVIAFLVCDAPLFFIDGALYFYLGWFHPIPGIALLLRLISFLIFGVASWLILLHRGSKFLFRRFKSADDLRHLGRLQAKNAERARDGIRVKYPGSKVLN